jgi:DHA1 family bicyclomycin/chloramphenicol resistance-like MFS transporter
MSSLIALSIDAMLPALPEIATDLGVQQGNCVTLIVTALFLGLAFGQALYGPLSDSFGRKPVIYLGFALFAAGTLLAITATDFDVMLLGRVLQGIGAAGPRIISIALVRDMYEGRAMARIMSLIMSVFILVPVLAPALGQAILLVAHWRMIFGLLFALAFIGAVWVGMRQPETLPPSKRQPFKLRRIGHAVLEVCTNRISFGYSLAAGCIFGAFIGYLSSAQPILQVQYGLGTLFPAYFAMLAFSIGLASLVNSKLVMKYGMQRLSGWALWAVSILSVSFFAVAYVFDGHPPLWALMANMVVSFFCIGMLFGNFNALAMEPLGHIAGIGAAVVGSLMTFISLSLGTLIGQNYDGTVLPMVGGFAVYGIASLLITRWVQRV